MNPLMKQAVDMMQKSYAPYSGFHVGAALMGEDGVVYRGCNVENASYPVTLCAERAALAAGVSNGCRRFTALAVAGGQGGDVTAFCPPCGMCLQALTEFCSPDMPVVLFDGRVEKTLPLRELLPYAFSAQNLVEEQ